MNNPFDTQITDTPTETPASPKIKHFGWYDKDMFDMAVKDYLKRGYGDLGVNPSKDNRPILESRPRQTQQEGVDLLRGSTESAAALATNWIPGAYPFRTWLDRGEDTQWNLYTRKGEKPPPVYKAWQWLRHQAGYTGPTHYLASGLETIGETAQGVHFLVSEGGGLLLDTIGEGLDAIGINTEGTGIDLQHREKFAEWLDTMFTYHYDQKELAFDITDLIYGDADTVDKVMRKYRAESTDKELRLPKTSIGKLLNPFERDKFGHMSGYTEADVSMLVSELMKKYKEVKLNDKDSAMAQQFADGIVGHYGSMADFQQAIEQDPAEVAIDLIDILFIKGSLKGFTKGGKIYKAGKWTKKRIDNKTRRLKEWAENRGTERMQFGGESLINLQDSPLTDLDLSETAMTRRALERDLSSITEGLIPEGATPEGFDMPIPTRDVPDRTMMRQGDRPPSDVELSDDDLMAIRERLRTDFESDRQQWDSAIDTERQELTANTDAMQRHIHELEDIERQLRQEGDIEQADELRQRIQESQTELNQRLAEQGIGGTQTLPEEGAITQSGDIDVGAIETTGKKVSIEDIEAELGLNVDEAAQAADVDIDEIDSFLQGIDDLLDDDGNLNMQAGINMENIKKFLNEIKENWRMSPEDLKTYIQIKKGDIDKEVARKAVEAGNFTANQKAALLDLVSRSADKVETKLNEVRPKRGSTTAVGGTITSIPRSFAESGSLTETFTTQLRDNFIAKYNELKDKKTATGGKRTMTGMAKRAFNLDAAAGETAYNTFKKLYEELGYAESTRSAENLSLRWQELVDNTSKQKVADILKRSEHALVEKATNIELENLIDTLFTDVDGNITELGQTQIHFPNTARVIQKFKTYHLDTARGGAKERTYGSHIDYINRPAIKRMEQPINAFIQDLQKADWTYSRDVEERIRDVLSNPEIRANNVFKALQSADSAKKTDVGWFANREWVDRQLARAMQQNRELTAISDADVDDFVAMIRNNEDFLAYQKAENKMSNVTSIHDFTKLWHAINNQFEGLSGSTAFDHEDYAEFISALKLDLDAFAKTTDKKKLQTFVRDLNAIEKRLHDANIRGAVKTISEFSDDSKIAEFFLDPLAIDNDGLREVMAYMFEPKRTRTKMSKDTQHLFEGVRRTEKTSASEAGTKPYPRSQTNVGKWKPAQLKRALQSRNVRDWTPEQQLLVFRSFILKSMLEGLRPTTGVYTSSTSAGVVESSQAGLNIHRWKEMLSAIEADSPGRGEILFGEEIWRDMKNMKDTSYLAQLFTKGAGKEGLSGTAFDMLKIAWGEFLRRVKPGKEFTRKLRTDDPGPFPFKLFFERMIKWHPGMQIVSRRVEDATDKPDMNKINNFFGNYLESAEEYLKR